jgi:hypothetical protein
MGMFDHLRCEVPLPDGYQGKDFQTKDFECEMATHYIKGGGLYLDEGHCVSVPKHERPYPDAHDGTLQSMFGSMRWIPNLVHQPHFDGIVDFYDLDAQNVMHRYNAKFENGKLVGIAVAGSGG